MRIIRHTSERNEAKLKFWLAYKMAIKSILNNKVRSALTMLGVIIGVAAVIAAVGFAQGCMQSVTNMVEGMGTNVVTAMIIDRSESKSLSVDDLDALVESSEYIVSVSPYIMTKGVAKYRTESKTTTVTGTNETYIDMGDVTIQEGRFITRSDMDNNLKVAVIGSAVRRKLFEDANPLGQTVKVNGTNFTVVGLLTEKMNGADNTDDDMIVIPVNVAQRTLKIKNVTMFMASASESDTVDLAMKKMEEFLYNIFRDKDSFMCFTQESILGILGNISSIMMIIMGSIATISLVVGGIGIMNIMLVSVSERTREIGIRKAIGAKKKDILIQFLIEALMLTGMGGVIGILLGMAIIKFVIGAIDMITPVYSVPWIIASFTISLLIGIIFGIFPAYKAAKLNPIDALRNE